MLVKWFTVQYVIAMQNIMLQFKIICINWREAKTIVHTKTCTRVFIAASFTIARNWKQPKCPSASEWVDERWCIYTGQHSSTNKNEASNMLQHGWTGRHATWNKSKRSTYHAIPFIWNVSSRQIHRDRKCISCCQGLEELGVGSAC